MKDLKQKGKKMENNDKEELSIVDNPDVAREIIREHIEDRVNTYRKRSDRSLFISGLMIVLALFTGFQAYSAKREGNELRGSIEEMTEENAEVTQQLEDLKNDYDVLVSDNAKLQSDFNAVSNRYKDSKERERVLSKALEEAKDTIAQSEKKATTQKATKKQVAPAAATKQFRVNLYNNKLHDIDCGSGATAEKSVIVDMTYEELQAWGNYCGNCDPEKTPAY